MIIVDFKFDYRQKIILVILIVVDIGFKIIFEYNVDVFDLFVCFRIIEYRKSRFCIYIIAQTLSKSEHKLSIFIENDRD